MTAAELDPSHHVFRHIKKSWMDGDFIEPAAFRLRRQDNGQLEKGLSVNWVEYFKKHIAEEAVPSLREIFIKKGRNPGGKSKFALLNVGASKAAAARYTNITIVHDEEKDDPSHSLIKDFEAFNDQVAEELAKTVIAAFPVRPSVT